jgi:2-phosphosulfolactate phosphatase
LTGDVEIRRATLDTCAEATGTVVVIDVLRAFTTAAYALAAGALDIILVASVEEAFALRAEHPGILLMGEVGGWPIAGFDFGNSPSAFVERDLSGCHLVQRTSAGTQGVVLSRQADSLLAASLVCASATAGTIRRHAPASLTFVITGAHSGRSGDEDAACADLIEALLKGESLDVAEIARRVRASDTGQLFTDPASAAFPPADLACAVDIDRFDFAMRLERQAGRLVMAKA